MNNGLRYTANGFKLNSTPMIVGACLIGAGSIIGVTGMIIGGAAMFYRHPPVVPRAGSAAERSGQAQVGPDQGRHDRGRQCLAAAPPQRHAARPRLTRERRTQRAGRPAAGRPAPSEAASVTDLTMSAADFQALYDRVRMLARFGPDDRRGALNYLNAGPARGCCHRSQDRPDGLPGRARRASRSGGQSGALGRQSHPIPPPGLAPAPGWISPWTRCSCMCTATPTAAWTPGPPTGWLLQLGGPGAGRAHGGSG